MTEERLTTTANQQRFEAFARRVQRINFNGGFPVTAPDAPGETTTLTLTDFLLARIAERESLAVLRRSEGNLTATEYEYELAECEAKRRLVGWVTEEWHYFGDTTPKRVPTTRDGEMILHILALPYADHPEYDESWRP